MEVIICQACDQIIDYVEAEKVGTLYAKCQSCSEKEKKSSKHSVA